MLPSVKPLVTAAPLFCLWKPNTAPLPAVLLLPYSWKAWLKVAGPAKVAAAFTSRLFPLELPIVALPNALNAFPAVMLTGALAITGDAKVVLALTPSVLLEVVPTTALPNAVNAFPAVMLKGALAMTDAAKVATAFTVRL